jgi:AraC-like DNA-binding protein
MDMKTDSGAEPLHRFPMFLTSDPEELRHYSSTLLGAARIELANTDNFAARVNFIKLPDIGLAFGATSCDLAADLLEADFIRLQIALKGRAVVSAGGTATDANARQHAITAAGVASRSVCEAGHERLTLRLNPETLRQKLTAILGVKPRGEMMLAPAMAADQPYARSLCQLLDFLSQQLDSTASRLPAAACRELEQAVQIAFLWASQHAFSHLLERQDKEPAPGIVRRLEEFIEANWQEALSIDRLAAEAGVSARSIFRAFDRSRGYSPMAFVKAIRLRQARAALMSGDPRVSVTATAFKCNFASPGHFARDYRDAFGELPSETISRNRR